VVHTFHALGVVKRRYQGSADTSPPQRIRAESAIARHADKVIATCGEEVAELHRMGMPRRSAHVVPCGVDLAAFRPEGATAERSARPRLLSLGRLVPRKGVDTAVEAMRYLRDAELFVAGGPPAEEFHRDPEVTRLRWIASLAGVSDRVRFLGRVDRGQVPALMRSADLVVCVPWYEPFGIVPLEAMACGVPVVASAVGGLTDTVVHGETGVLVPPRDANAVANATRRLLADPEYRRTLGAAGHRRVRSRYTWPKVGDSMLDVYGALVRESAVAAGGGPA
jgi:glycosyltransferase involved in cell wall biosynthesis